VPTYAPAATAANDPRMPDAHAPVALITGASSGIGLATARILAAHGWVIALAGRRAEPLHAAAESLRASTGVPPHLALKADIASSDQCALLVERTVAAFGRIDALVNNAGHAPLLPIERHTPAIVREVFDVNALGPANLILACWPHMCQRRTGRIVNVSSMATVDPFAGFFAYAAAKAGLELMVKSVAKEGRSRGVRAFAVAPGAVETPMLRSILSERLLSRDKTLSPDSVATVIADCARGTRDEDSGKTILVPSP